MRRDEIIAAAFEEFCAHGLYGTSTDTIARQAGISQPYLFRLFGTKKELYLEAVDAASARRSSCSRGPRKG